MLSNNFSYKSMFGTISPLKTAITTNKHDTYSYSDLHLRICYYAKILILNKVPSKGCVSFLLSDPFEMAAVSIATIKLKRVLFPISPNMASKESIINMLTLSKPSFFIYDDSSLTKNILSIATSTFNILNESVNPDFDLVCSVPEIAHGNNMSLIMHSSGSTGTPKMVYYNHDNLMALFDYKINHFGFSNSTTCMTCSAGYHLNGFYMTICTLLKGGHILNSFEMTGDKLFEFIRSNKPDILVLYPDLLVDFTNRLEKFSTQTQYIRHLITGGDTVPVNTLKRFYKLTGTLPTTMIGMTECPTYMGNNTQEDKLGSFGRKPLIGYEVRLRDIYKDSDGSEVGELELRSTAASCGYLSNDKTGGVKINSGWIQTGDILKCDPDGYYWFVSRRKDVLLRNAITIPLSEIEDTLLTYPAVDNACVVVTENKDFGFKNYDRNITAFIKFKEKEDLVGLKLFVADNLAKFKNPDEFFAVDNFPRNASGKIDKRELIRAYREPRAILDDSARAVPDQAIY